MSIYPFQNGCPPSMLDQPQSVSSMPGNQLQRQWCKAGIAADLILTGDPPSDAELGLCKHEGDPTATYYH